MPEKSLPQTPAEFRLALQRLEDSSTDLLEWIVDDNFGYCHTCKQITKYRWYLDADRGDITQCLECKGAFTWDDRQRGYTTWGYREFAPIAFRAQLAAVRTKEFQRKLLFQLLGQRREELDRKREEISQELVEVDEMRSGLRDFALGCRR